MHNPRVIGRRAAREVRALLVQGKLIADAMVRGEDPSPRAEKTVIFAHGYSAAGPVLAPMRRYVERECGVTTQTFTYMPLTHFEDAAERLYKLVKADATPERPVSVVGHSLGGLLARWVVQEMGAHDLVDRIVTLATPHGGTSLANYMVGPLVTELRPGSRVLRTLDAGRERAAHIHQVAFVAGSDVMILPASSAAALPGADIRWFDGVGHNEMLFHEGVFRSLADALLGPAIDPNQAGK